LEGSSLFRNRHFWAAVWLLLFAVAIAVVTYQRLYPAEAFIGRIQVFHWMGIIGAGIIAVFVPLYAFLKRRYPKTRKALFISHMYVNLLAFEFVSAHFGVLGEVKPQVDTGTGFLQYIVVSLLVLTGIFRRFQIAPAQTQIWRFLHLSLVVSFYIILVNHILGALRLV